MKKAYLVLSNGQIFEGFRFGAEADTVGELVFTTGVNGYLQTLTDPASFGQIVLQTFPMIGNYGTVEADLESNCTVKGYVVREWCSTPSNFRSEGDLDALLKKLDVPGIWGVDTRALTAIIREAGVMNAMICGKLPDSMDDLRKYKITGAVEAVTAKSVEVYPAADAKYIVAVMDYGVCKSLIEELNSRGCTVTVYPAATEAEAVLAINPDGVVLSEGPGNPNDNTAMIAEIAKLQGKVPMLALGLGHQMLALANGAAVTKMKTGHRGGNQPVREVTGTRTYVTTQNHGYVVNAANMTNGTVRFINANDGTCAGISYADAQSVQFRLTDDTAFLYDEFIARMGGNANAAE
jgi:carbamoyl-phosphate synthase small subunit